MIHAFLQYLGSQMWSFFESAAQSLAETASAVADGASKAIAETASAVADGASKLAEEAREAAALATVIYLCSTQ